MRPDYCPVGNEPCQSLCDTPCTILPKRPWVGLTDEDIKEIWLAGIDNGDDWLDVRGIARAIESKVKEKNHD